ncbi:hypothetical protein BDK51DRAFT_48723 [Blyttiomyces helicus]|uniref:Uncharacterized protein n=1 Tax=Blyttiomyces helicus TaxID=388810 RepID=A0A4P9VXI3_9FUNG|nr:hypothetical protein BDK51DRAFT_48723 [Blyttiomyces helicus]|eukprot:RKO83625.1 hypothetical protein BDK51DRAFT_48723 [Blyttiomyces helicus]
MCRLMETQLAGHLNRWLSKRASRAHRACRCLLLLAWNSQEGSLANGDCFLKPAMLEFQSAESRAQRRFENVFKCLLEGHTLRPYSDRLWSILSVREWQILSSGSDVDEEETDMFSLTQAPLAYSDAAKATESDFTDPLPLVPICALEVYPIPSLLISLARSSPTSGPTFAPLGSQPCRSSALCPAFARQSIDPSTALTFGTPLPSALCGFQRGGSHLDAMETEKLHMGERGGAAPPASLLSEFDLPK